MENNDQVIDGVAREEVSEQPSQVDLNNYVDKDLVNRIVIESKDKAYNSGYAAAKKELEQIEADKSKSSDAPILQETPDNASVESFDEDKIRELAKQEMLRMAEDERKQREEAVLAENAHKLQQELYEKTKRAAAKYDDFDDVTGGVDFSEFPEVLVYANNADNAGDVLYHLAKDPHKIAMLRASTPSLAVSQINTLSNSIKRNEEASKQKFASDPIDRISPSNVGSVDRDLSREEQLRQLRSKYHG